MSQFRRSIASVTNSVIRNDRCESLREEIERADVAPDDVAPNSVVGLGCEVTLVDRADAQLRQAQLVLPDEAQRSRCISVQSPIGSALNRPWARPIDSLDRAT